MYNEAFQDNTPKMSFGEMSFGEMSFGEMSFGEMSFGEMSFGEMSFGVHHALPSQQQNCLT